MGCLEHYTDSHKQGLTKSESICTMTKSADLVDKRASTSVRLLPGGLAKIVDSAKNKIIP